MDDKEREELEAYRKQEKEQRDVRDLARYRGGRKDDPRTFVERWSDEWQKNTDFKNPKGCMFWFFWGVVSLMIIGFIFGK